MATGTAESKVGVGVGVGVSGGIPTLPGIVIRDTGVAYQTDAEPIFGRVSQALWRLEVYGLKNGGRPIPRNVYAPRTNNTTSIGGAADPETVTADTQNVRVGDVWVCADGKVCVVVEVLGYDTPGDIVLYCNGVEHRISRARLGYWLLSLGAVPVGSVQKVERLIPTRI